MPWDQAAGYVLGIAANVNAMQAYLDDDAIAAKLDTTDSRSALLVIATDMLIHATRSLELASSAEITR